MTYTKKLVFLVATLLLAVFAVQAVSAFGQITSVQVNGVEAINGAANIGSFAGDTLPIKVLFVADSDASDVRIKADIIGASTYSAVTDRFETFNGSTYVRNLAVQMPYKIDPTESLKLEVTVESRDGQQETAIVNLAAQRESYVVQILDVTANSQVTAGDSLRLDVVLKNRGLREAEDTFVSASIPALGIQAKGYFGDMSSLDQGNDSVPTKNDAAERILVLNIPSNAPAGVYNVQVDAYNGDSVTSQVLKVAVVGSSANTNVISSVSSKTFSAGQTAEYSITLVNAGNKIAVYQLVLNTPNGLNVNLDQPVVAVPAGSATTVKIGVSAQKAGTYSFAVNVQDMTGSLVQTQAFTANVQSGIGAGNATVLLTVILAIVFVVLLVVLIVLLTRKPRKTEEFSESYY